MATSTQQKQELFKSIWAIANELRGSVDGWDFKQYVLGMLFYRYISENITNYPAPSMFAPSISTRSFLK